MSIEITRQGLAEALLRNLFPDGAAPGEVAAVYNAVNEVTKRSPGSDLEDAQP